MIKFYVFYNILELIFYINNHATERERERERERDLIFYWEMLMNDLNTLV